MQDIERRNILTQYIRDKKGKHLATLVAVKLGNVVYFGWSKFNRSKEKIQFTKKFGRARAIYMAIENNNLLIPMPFIVKEGFNDFVSRSESYFRDVTLMLPAIHKNIC